MPRKQNSLKYELFTTAIKDVTNNRTKTSYKRSVNRFIRWAKENKVKRKEDITTEVIQKYHDDLKADPKQYTAATIHTYLAPICKAAGINLNRIRKNKRTSDKIIRGRRKEKNAQGKFQEKDSRFSRIVNFQKVVGIRRSELRDLTGKDFIQDELGNYYVVVKRGKGGKYQEQLILPQDVELVKNAFKGYKSDQKIFSDQELNNLINFHGMRAQHSRDSYYYFLDKIQSDENYKRSLKNQLIKRWEEGHKELRLQSLRKFMSHRNNFIHDLRDDPYVLRGSNFRKAIASEMPTTYNRLALMAVSVLNQSHWRLSVTVTNYIL